MLRYAAGVIVSFSLSGCALNPYFVEDPTTIAGIGPKVADVVKSLRCEIVTFLQENKLRSDIWAKYIETTKRQAALSDSKFNERVDFLRRYPHLDIDSAQFASLTTDFKNVDTLTMTIGYDWKKIVDAKGGFFDWHIGPSYADTRTFQLTQQHAISQAAALGPQDSATPKGATPPKAASFSTIYNALPQADESFYCYKSLFNSTSITLEDAADDIQHLLQHDPGWEVFANFTRVIVGPRFVTLAKWLQDTATEMSKNERTIYDTSEKVLNGQLQYQFILDVKPSIDPKYTLMAGHLSPVVPSATISLQHAGTFTIYLNAEFAAAALQAKSGNAKLPSKTVQWW